MQDEAFGHKLEAMWTSTQHIIAQDFHVDALVQTGLKSRYANAGDIPGRKAPRPG